MDSRERNVEFEQGLSFQGFARIGLASLKFEEKAHRPISERNVARLTRIFRREGCRRTDANNFVTAVADEELLANATSTLTCPAIHKNVPVVWSDSPLLPITFISCLDGLHRTKAATRFLDDNDQWWIVRIYTKELSARDRREIAEEYRNEDAPSDGEIFYKIRLYHREQDFDNEQRWWARLTRTKSKDLKQLLKDDRFSSFFDEILPWPGLWSPIMLGSLHRLLTMKCEEEMLNYLSCVVSTWRNIVDGTSAIFDNTSIDLVTVERLEALAPGISQTDADIVKKLVEGNEVFARVTAQGDRNIVLHNILALRGTIPSLRTFFEDLKYLEPCAKVLRALLPVRSKRSIMQALSACYFPPDKTVIEHSCGDLRTQVIGDRAQNFAFGYQQLWLFPLRNFPAMTEIMPRKETTEEKPTVDHNPLLWQRFGSLAVSLGFRTSAAQRLAASDGIRDLAAQVVCKADIELPQIQQAIGKIADILRRPDVGSRGLQEAPAFTSDGWLSQERRYGRPYVEDHKCDREFLFLPFLYRAFEPQHSAISTFCRKWEMFRRFHGIGFDESLRFDSEPHHRASDESERIQTDSEPDDHQAALRAALAETARLQQQYSELRIEVNERDERIRRLLGEVDRHEGDARAAGSTANQTISRLESERNSLELSVRSLRAQLDDLLSSGASQSSQSEQLRQCLSTAKQEVEQLRAEACTARDQIGTLKAQIVSYEEGAVRSGEMAQDLTKKYQRDQLVLQELEQANKDNAARIDTLTNDLATAHSICEAKDGHISGLDNALAALKEEFRAISARESDLGNEFAACRQRVRELEAENQRLESLGYSEAVARINDRRTFDDATRQHQEELNAHQDSLRQVLNEIANQQNLYRRVMETQQQGFLVLRAFAFVDGFPKVADHCLSLEAAEYFLGNERFGGVLFSELAFFVGPQRQKLPYRIRANIWDAWCQQGLLWVCPQNSADDLSSFWSANAKQYSQIWLKSLEEQGFTFSKNYRMLRSAGRKSPDRQGLSSAGVRKRRPTGKPALKAPYEERALVPRGSRSVIVKEPTTHAATLSQDATPAPVQARSTPAYDEEL